jgi:hypothetical protein
MGGAAASAAAPVAAPATFMNERLLRRSIWCSFPADAAAVGGMQLALIRSNE